MPRYACIDESNKFVHREKFRIYDHKPDDLPHKGLRWVPADPAAPPNFDPETQVREGPTYTIAGDAVVEAYNVRNKSGQELDADKDEKVSEVNKVLAAVLFDVVNEIRSLKAPAQPALTQAQFVAYLKKKIGSF